MENIAKTADQMLTTFAGTPLATAWPSDCHIGVEQAIAEFKERLPGWWFSLGECQVSCDASCAPTRESADIDLISFDDRFNSGFHIDLEQPSTLAAALREVMQEALKAKDVASHPRQSSPTVQPGAPA